MSTKFSEDWTTFHQPVWKKCLAGLENRPIEAIELGCFEGRSTLWFLENILQHADSRITCVDIFSSQAELSKTDFALVKQNFLHNTKDYADKITLIEEFTHVYLKNRKQMADLIYIDASHFAKDVFIDAALSHLLLNPRGILLFDDYLWNGLEQNTFVPKPAIDAFMSCFGNNYGVLALGYQVLLQKK